jgi:prefoldin alpha subunit
MDQNKMMEYQAVSKQLTQIKSHLAQLQKHKDDLEVMKDSLSYLDSVEDGKEIMVPLGSGVFFRSEKVKGNKIIMNVGAGVVVEKTFTEASRVVDDQIREISEVISQMDMNHNFLMNKENHLRSCLQGGCSCGDHSCGEDGCHC